MKILRIFLVVATVAIYALTLIATVKGGLNWPAVAISDLLELSWRSQFNTDFLVHLFLLATWVVWREGATLKAYVYGFLSIVLGGMFSFPYIVYATYKAHAEPKALLLGVRA